MLISHRNSAYVDIPDLERAAGLIEQKINSETLTDIIEIAHFEGAGIILRLLAEYDFKTAQDLMIVFQKVLNDLAK